MTNREIKQKEEQYKRFLLIALNSLRFASKVTGKEYEKIRNRILEGKEVD